MADSQQTLEKRPCFARQEKEKYHGKLKIFFSYCAGAGKTYAMLEAAIAEKENGIDVIAGYIESHLRQDTIALAEKLECLPKKKIEYHGAFMYDFDLDAALLRKPQLILVDELAHTNTPGSRHEKRYQDIEELLKNGIDVYTTVNIQHIESLSDTMTSITGVTVRERIPDCVFNNADEVEFVDIEPTVLLERLEKGKIHQASQAREHFFTIKNIAKLREIALDKAKEVCHKYDYAAGEHILVCLASSIPTSEKIIREAARLAGAFHAKFTALFIEAQDFSQIGKDELKRMRDNLHLAQKLGAAAVESYGNDIAEQIAEYSKVAGVSKVVLGRTSPRRSLLFYRESFPDQVARLAPDAEIVLVPDSCDKKHIRKEREGKHRSVLPDLWKFLAVLVAATLVSYAFVQLGISEANIITVYILGVLMTAMLTRHRIYCMLSPAASILTFNFFYTDPKFTFSVNDPDYL